MLAGSVTCSTIDQRHHFGVGNAVVLEPCVFHSSRAGDDAAFLMEVETPPMKGDLVRFKDDFGRSGTGYESAAHHCEDVSGFAYRPLRTIEHGGAPFDFHALRLQLLTIAGAADLRREVHPDALLVPFLGRIVFNQTIVADMGEAVPAAALLDLALPPYFPPVELLQVMPPS